ncbi:MAG: hypothetical protein V8Q17_03720 [Acutalibacteraceae bacterium]
MESPIKDGRFLKQLLREIRNQSNGYAMDVLDGTMEDGQHVELDLKAEPGGPGGPEEVTRNGNWRTK